MKKILFSVFLFLFTNTSNNLFSQGIFNKIKDKVKQRIDQKENNAIDKGLDKTEDAAKTKEKIKTDEGEVKVKTNENGEVKIKTKGEVAGLQSYSRYDFIPGDKIVYAEDFSQDVIGEFPLKWNTNGSGEVVTIQGLAGKWLQLSEGTHYTTPYKGKLPDNYTAEFDFLLGFKSDQRVPDFAFLISKQSTNNNAPGLKFVISPNGGQSTSQGEQLTSDKVALTSYDSKANIYLQAKDQLLGQFTKFNNTQIPIHIAIWVQKERVRAWINQQKVYDLPKAMAPNVYPEQIAFDVSSYGGPKSNYNYYISNLKVAVAPPETRSKLITEGKFSTTGILFDVNSDKIKPTSYGVLKEIAGVLNENPDVKVKIIGHTDSDGDAAKNLDLSKRRAAAVKAALAADFNVDANRL